MMVQKQFFIEAGQNRRLKALALATGKSEGELIRDGLEAILEKAKAEIDEDWKVGLRRLRGMWADRDDLDDYLQKRRASWRRRRERLFGRKT